MTESWQGCAVCGYPLDHRRTGDQWFHARDDMQEHVAVPVDMDQLNYNQKCDFCDADEPGWVVLADSFELPTLGSRSIGPWMACNHCMSLVEKRHWSRLLTWVKSQGGPVTRDAARNTLLDAWKRLDSHMHGIITEQEWRERHNFWEVPVD